MKNIFISILNIFVLLSCKKEKMPCSVDPPYVRNGFTKGKVHVGIDSSVSTPLLYTYFNNLNLPISTIWGDNYISSISKDSIFYIDSILNTKSYIKNGGFSSKAWSHYQTGVVHITNLFFNMSIEKQQDFLQVKNFLRMINLSNNTNAATISVPAGDEEYWIGELKTKTWVKWADYKWNYVKDCDN